MPIWLYMPSKLFNIESLSSCFFWNENFPLNEPKFAKNHAKQKNKLSV